MHFIFDKQTFIDILKITSIKNYEYSINNIVSTKTGIECEFKIKIIYLNQDLEEEEIISNIPIEIFVEDGNYDISAENIKLDVVDGQGVFCNYNIVLNSDEYVIPCNKKEEFIVSSNENCNVDDFLNFFYDKENKYYNIVTIKVNNKNDLEEISKKYDIAIKDLYKGYDEEIGYVVFNK